MTGCFIHEFPGPSRRFSRFIQPDEPAGFASEVAFALRAFEDVFEPLRYEAELMAMDPELGIHVWDVRIREATQVLSAALPPHVVAPAWSAAGASMPRLTPDVVERWLGALLGRSDAPPGTVLAVATLSVHAARARLVGALTNHADLPLRTARSAPGFVAVPIERGTAGAWVSGPLADTPSQPPLRLEFSYENGVLQARLNIEWSPWDEDPACSNLVERAIARMIAGGWANA